MKKKFSLSGLPDFSTLSVQNEYVLSIIKAQFISFGFLPISTSLIEKGLTYLAVMLKMVKN